MKSRVVICGNFGFGNIGDEAVLESTLSKLRDDLADPLVSILSGNPTDTHNRHKVRAISWKDLDGISEALKVCNLVVLCGGILHDYWRSNIDDIFTERHHGLAYYSGISLVATLRGIPISLFEVGVGPLTTTNGQRMAGAIAKAAANISVRDQKSFDLLHELGVEKERMQLSSDPAFRLEIPKASEAEPVNESKPQIGVNLRSWEFGVGTDSWLPEVARGLGSFLDKWDARALLIPFQQLPESAGQDDRKVLERLKSMLGPNRVARIANCDSWQEACQHFQKCDLLLAMRYHAGLFGLRTGRRVIGLAYDTKCVSLLDDEPGASFLSPADWSGPLIEEELSRHMREIETHGLDHTLGKADQYIHLDPFPVSKGRASAVPPQSKHSMLLLGAERFIESEEARTIEKLRNEISSLRERERRLELEIIGLSEVTNELKATLDAERWSRREAQLRAVGLQEELTRIRTTLGYSVLKSYWWFARKVFHSTGTWGEKALHALKRLLDLLAMNVKGSPANSTSAEPGGHAIASDEVQNGVLADSDPWFRLQTQLFAFEDMLYAQPDAPVVFITSATNFDHDEGQRPTNLAIEYAKSGAFVIFGYWRWDKAYGPEQDHLEEGIFEVPLDALLGQPRQFLELAGDRERWLQISFPHPQHFGLLALCHSEGWVTVYDVLDDWQAFRSVGMADWYDRDFEAHVASSVDLVVVVSEQLQTKVKELTDGAVDAAVIPNGAPRDIAQVEKSVSLERGKITIGYFGHLSDAWFDWQLIREVGQKEQDWMIYLIGYGSDRARIDMPANVELLGKKPQSILSAYAANWDVGIVPFREGPVAASTDAIKIYEYLAMGLPVVTTGVPAPNGAERWVKKASSKEEFIAMVKEAVELGESDRYSRIDFGKNANWGRRAQELRTILKSSAERIAEKHAIAG